jgi:hypothetical protein
MRSWTTWKTWTHGTEQKHESCEDATELCWIVTARLRSQWQVSCKETVTACESNTNLGGCCAQPRRQTSLDGEGSILCGEKWADNIQGPIRHTSDAVVIDCTSHFCLQSVPELDRCSYYSNHGWYAQSPKGLRSAPRIAREVHEAKDTFYRTRTSLDNTLRDAPQPKASFQPTNSHNVNNAILLVPQHEASFQSIKHDIAVQPGSNNAVPRLLLKTTRCSAMVPHTSTNRLSVASLEPPAGPVGYCIHNGKTAHLCWRRNRLAAVCSIRTIRPRGSGVQCRRLLQRPRMDRGAGLGQCLRDAGICGVHLHRSRVRS